MNARSSESAPTKAPSATRASSRRPSSPRPRERTASASTSPPSARSWRGGRIAAAAARGGLELGGRDAGHEAQRAEHLDVLLVPRSDLADGALARVGQVVEDAETQALAQLVAEASPLRRVLEGVDRLLRHGPG